MGFEYENITEKIIGISFEVMNELGAGFLESVYERSLLVALREKEISVENKLR